jgi:hypothetical protein
MPRVRKPVSQEHRDKLKAAAQERASRKRYYLTMSVKKHPWYVDKFDRIAYVKLAWPKLFRSEQEAFDYLATCRHAWTSYQGRKVVSFAANVTYLPKREK